MSTPTKVGHGELAVKVELLTVDLIEVELVLGLTVAPHEGHWSLREGEGAAKAHHASTNSL